LLNNSNFGIDLHPKTHARHIRLAVFCLALAIASILFVFWTLQTENISPNMDVPPKLVLVGSTEVLKDTFPIVASSTRTKPSSPKTDKTMAFDDSFCENIAQEMTSENSRSVLRTRLEEQYRSADKELEAKLSLSTQNQTPQSQAAALYLKAQLQASNARSNFFTQHPDCDSGNACEAQTVEAANLSKQHGINEIAKLASYSPDPQLYAMAFHACNSLTDSQFGFCKQISASQWAQRDPNNAMAWLHTITQIAKTGKGKPNAELDTAMFRLSQTKKFDLGLSSISQFQRSEQMQSENVFARQKLILLGSAVFMGESLPAYQHILSYCPSDALLDNNRRQICNGIANNLLSDESNLIGETIALKIGERLAWSPEKIANLREELDAIHELQRSVFDGLILQQNSDPTSQALHACRWMVKNTNDLENRLQYGEMHEIRHRMARQKTSRAELASRYRASKNRIPSKENPDKSSG
jgi:hypothetical protein